MRIAPGMLLYAIMTPVCFVYAVYIGLQASYLFSGFAGTLPEGFSYAGYARSGFFELCFLSVLNFLLIALLFLACRRQGDARPLPLRIYSGILCVITLLLIAPPATGLTAPRPETRSKPFAVSGSPAASHG